MRSRLMSSVLLSAVVASSWAMRPAVAQDAPTAATAPVTSAAATSPATAPGTSPAGDAPTTNAATRPVAGMRVRLWDGDAPGAQGQEDSAKPTNDVPSVTVYPPPEGKNNGSAMVICPGGGYGGLAGHEAKPVADWVNAHGGTGVVLRYRLGPKYRHPAMLNDVTRAIQLTRHHAQAWGIDPNRIGVIGFSAGGHLASTAATHFDYGDAASQDPVARASGRPDVAVLVYPVIMLDGPASHAGSRKNLLGDNPDAKLVEVLSTNRAVTPKSPPCYLVHSSDDKVVPVENALAFASALAQHKIPFAMRVFDHGAHGYGMGGGQRGDDELASWPESCAQWLEFRGFYKPAGK